VRSSRNRACPIVALASQEEWERWLEKHQAESAGLWLKIAKKGSEHETVLYPEALESGLCYGWIDGQKGSYGEDFWLQKFTPRRARSRWSRINRDKAAELVEQARMKPAGLVEVERARADGRWEAAYEGQSRATIPEDLQRELDRNPEAKAFFETLDSANRYAILYRIQDAKRPETRARRIEQYVAMLAEHRKLHG
jgi:uncharacterized protein YdeI (YjbR/CyaY-like superfamily)